MYWLQQYLDFIESLIYHNTVSASLKHGKGWHHKNSLVQLYTSTYVKQNKLSILYYVMD